MGKGGDITINQNWIPSLQPVENEQEDSFIIPAAELKPTQVVEDEQEQKAIVPFSGKLMTADDPVIIGKNFKTLTNMRYSEDSPKSISGMTKINTDVINATYFKTRNAFQYRKVLPSSVETHILAQAWNTGLTAARVYDNATAPPAQGAFTATEVWTDDADGGYGYFSDAPDGNMAYCNGIETCIWGGNEARCTRILNYDSGNTFLYDFTDYLTNSDPDESVSFSVDPAGGGIGSNTVGLYHLDNALTDSSGNSHTLTKVDGTFVTSLSNYGRAVYPKFGTHFLKFDGSNDYCTIADHSDFDFSGGVWTIDFWAAWSADANNPIYYKETPVTKIIFASGSHEPVVGDPVSQITSGATGKINKITLSTGAWASGDAAGTIWLDTVTGAWSNGNNMIEVTDLLSGDGAFDADTNWTAEATAWTYNAVTKAMDKDAAGTGTLAHNTLAAVAGEIYRVTFTVSGLTAGDVTASFGGASGSTRSADGTYTETLTAVSTAGLSFTPSNTARLTIDSVTVNTTVLSCSTCTTDTNYMLCNISFSESTWNDSLSVVLREYGVSTTTVSISGDIFAPLIAHVEFAENGNTWYIFVNGDLLATATSSARPLDYTSDVYVGRNVYSSTYLAGVVDELRISKSCQHTSAFTPQTTPYSSIAPTMVYIQTPRPAKGFKFYIGTANTAASVASGSVFTGSDYTSLSLTDGTASSGKTLAQTGSITFASTVSTAKTKYLYGTVAYTYAFSFPGVDAATKIYQITADMPFQPIVDFWDGSNRSVGKFYVYTSSYQDYTANVFQDQYDSSYEDTYCKLVSLTSSQWIEVGFTERMTAIGLNVVSAQHNAVNNTVATLYYWNGAEYVSVGTATDGTSSGVISLYNAGVLSWNAPSETLEYTKSLMNGIPMYYYKIAWNQTMSADVRISYVYGIPAQTDISGYKFPIYSQDRLMLCNEISKYQNGIRVSAYETAQVFNGDDSSEILVGNADAINCGCTLFAMYGSSLYNITMLFKDTEIWGLVFSDGWRKYRIAETVGCPAPMTLNTCIIPPTEGQQAQANRSFAIWCSADGVYTSDGRHPVCVSWDIRDLFNQNATTHINQSYIESFSAFIDKNAMEYHLLVALTTGVVTTLDAEYVLDLRQWKWFKVDRTSGLRLQCGVSVIDAYGNNHTYGFIETGYMERLEYGTTFDGQAIVSTMQTGDFPLIDRDFLTETSLQCHVLIMAAKTYETMTLDVAPGGAGWSVGNTITGVTSGATSVIVAKASGTSYTVYQRSKDYTLGEVLTNGTDTADQGASYPTLVSSVTATHYVDTSTTGTDYTISTNNVGYRLSFPVNIANSTPGIFHSFKYVHTSAYETVGFEPIALGCFFHPIREYNY